MGAASLAKSRFEGTSSLRRLLPPGLAGRAGRWLATNLARQRGLSLISALRANMAVVHNLTQDDPELDQLVASLLENALCSYSDLLRAAAAGPQAIDALCQLDPASLQAIEDCRATGQGLLLVGAHMCSFELLLLGLRRFFPTVQVLSKANPAWGTRLTNSLRRGQGIEVTPISMKALRQAIGTLRAGGVVAIAADLPAENGEEMTFFGRRARLAVGHSRLALKTKARMLVCASYRLGRGAYRAEVVQVPRPASTGSQKQDSLRWARASLAALERLIARAPDQWLMPQRIWPAPAAEAERVEAPAASTTGCALAQTATLAGSA